MGEQELKPHQIELRKQKVVSDFNKLRRILDITTVTRAFECSVLTTHETCELFRIFRVQEGVVFTVENECGNAYFLDKLTCIETIEGFEHPGADVVDGFVGIRN